MKHEAIRSIMVYKLYTNRGLLVFLFIEELMYTIMQISSEDTMLKEYNKSCFKGGGA